MIRPARLFASLLAGLSLLCTSPLLHANEAEPFDYWVLSLSWSPSWCAIEGDFSDGEGTEAQCSPGAGRGFVTHGLWPQYELGWPEFCDSNAAAPSRRDSAEMADLMGSGGLAFYQWRKHGRCSGLSGRDYYAATRAASAAITMPEVFDQIDRALRLPVSVIEDAFIEVNPGLIRDGITVTCKSGVLSEVRICLDRSFNLRRCGDDIARDCSLPGLDLPPLR